MKKLFDTPIKSIRKTCLQCTCYQPKEIRLCTTINCGNYPFRMGTRPSEETIKNIEEYYAKNPKPTEEV